MDDPFLDHVKQSLQKDFEDYNQRLASEQAEREEQLQRRIVPMTDRNRYSEEPFGFDQYDLEEHIEKRQKQAKMDQFLDQGAIQQRIRAIEHKGIQKECERLGISIEEGYALLNDPELYSVFESLREDTSAGALRLAARRKGIEPKPKKQAETREQMADRTASDFRAIDKATQRTGDDLIDHTLKRLLPDDDKLLHYGVSEAPLPPSRRKAKRR